MFSSLQKRGYSFGEKIGEGSSSIVLRASFEDKKTGKTVKLACKIVDKKTAENEFLAKFFPREIEVLSKISHASLVDVQGILQSENVVFIFLRWEEKGDLLKHIQAHGRIEEHQAKFWFEQLAAGIEYLHGIGYAHRDLKCENIFISANNNVKIGDFGYSKNSFGDNKKKILSETFCGSKLYAAPEIIMNKPYDPFKSDIFSLGVVCFIMCNGTMPFENANSHKLHQLQIERTYNYGEGVRLTSDCWEMIQTLLEPNPTVRITAKEIFTMNWLKQ